MPLYIYKIEQSNEWDKIVKSFSTYDVYYLSGYSKAFHDIGDGEPMLFYYKDNNLRGINVVVKRDIADDKRFTKKIDKNKYYDFITPYGYGGWLIEGDSSNNILFDFYDQWCKENHIVCEFVRYHPVLNNSCYSKNYYDVHNLGNTIVMDLESPEKIWDNLSSKNRNMVRKAMKNGVRIFHGQFPSIYKKFRKIYNSTMKADNASSYYYFSEKFYNSILYDLDSEAQVFWAEFEGKIIAASIMIEANGFMNYHLSGSLIDYRHLAPNNLLLYKAALWGSANGYKTLHLGGGIGCKEDSLYRFKSSFNRNKTCKFCIGKKIFLNNDYLMLSIIRRKKTIKNFFPVYRE